MWRINRVEPSPHEHEVMDRARVSKIDAMRSFLAWRRTSLLAVLPILLLSCLIAIIDYAAIDFEGINGFGKLIFLLPTVAPWFMFGFAVASAAVWKKWRLSTRLLKIGWGTSFILPLVPAIFPLEHIYTQEVLDFYDNYATAEQLAFYQSIKIVVAVGYMLNILPIVVSFPGGTIRAALRIRALLPESSLSSWILVISSPFYSVLILMALVVILQLAGNILLIFGTLLLTINPWVYVYFRRLLVAVSTPKSEKQLDLLQRCIGISNLIGFILIILYVITSPDLKDFIEPAAVVRFALIGFSRTIVTTVLFGDVFLRMSITNWKRDGERRSNSNEGARIDALFETLEGNVGKASINSVNGRPPTSEKSGLSQDVVAGNEMTLHDEESGHSQNDQGNVSSSPKVTGRLQSQPQPEVVAERVKNTVVEKKTMDPDGSTRTWLDQLCGGSS